MQVIYATLAMEDRQYWERTNQAIVKRIDKLITDIKAHPFTGIGKPEPLKFAKQGYWSRRINQQHRLVYKVVNKTIYIVQCKYHY